MRKVNVCTKEAKIESPSDRKYLVTQFPLGGTREFLTHGSNCVGQCGGPFSGLLQLMARGYKFATAAPAPASRDADVGRWSRHLRSINAKHHNENAAELQRLGIGRGLTRGSRNEAKK